MGEWIMNEPNKPFANIARTESIQIIMVMHILNYSSFMVLPLQLMMTLAIHAIS